MLAISSFDPLSRLFVEAQLDEATASSGFSVDRTVYRRSIRSLLQVNEEDDEDGDFDEPEDDVLSDSPETYKVNEEGGEAGNGGEPSVEVSGTDFNTADIVKKPEPEKTEYIVGTNGEKIPLRSNMWSVETNAIDDSAPEVNSNSVEQHSSIFVNVSVATGSSQRNNDTVYVFSLELPGDDRKQVRIQTKKITNEEFREPAATTVTGYRFWGGECQCSCPCMENDERIAQTSCSSVLAGTTEDGHGWTEEDWITSTDAESTTTESNYWTSGRSESTVSYTTEGDVKTTDYGISSAETTEYTTPVTEFPLRRPSEGNVMFICT